MSWLVRFQGRVFIRAVRLSRLISTAKNTRRNAIAARSRTAAVMITCTPSNGGGACARWSCDGNRGAGCAGLRGGSRKPRRLTTSSRCRREGRTSWTTCSRFARAAIAGKRHGIPDGLGGAMPPGGRGAKSSQVWRCEAHRQPRSRRREIHRVSTGPGRDGILSEKYL